MVKSNGLPLAKDDEVPLPVLPRTTTDVSTPCDPSNKNSSDFPLAPVAQKKKNPYSSFTSAFSSLPFMVKSSPCTTEASEESQSTSKKVDNRKNKPSHSFKEAVDGNSHLPHYLLSPAAQDTPDAGHVQRKSPILKTAESDNISQPSKPTRYIIPQAVVSPAKMAPNQGDETQLVNKDLQENMQQAVVVKRVITGKPSSAGGTTSSSSSNQVLRKWWIYILLIVLVGIVGIAVGVTLYLKNKEEQPTAAPSLPPSLPPNITNNNVCSAAIPIEPGIRSISGSLTNVTRSNEIDTSCAHNAEAPRKWYSLVGDGSVYRISTCTDQLTFNSALSVSTGSCDNQDCVTIGEVLDGCGKTSAKTARVVFRTKNDVEYFIALENSNFLPGGNFALEVSILEAPPNDLCSAAISIDSGNVIIPGSLTNAPVLQGFNSSCGSNSDAPRVWYSMVGDGDAYAISTCTSQLTFDSALSLFTGSCDNQECIPSTVSNFSCDESSTLASRVLFLTEVGVEYFISVENPNSFSGGEFELNVSKVEPPPNDSCSTATPIEPGSRSIFGSLTNAVVLHGFSSSCGSIDEASRVWYSLVGDGDTYAISTCTSQLSLDVTLSVVTGSCDIQECITIGYDNYECTESLAYASRVVFRTVVGVEYFISVESSNIFLEEGDFVLDVSKVDAPLNDICSAAISILPGNSTIRGTITDATVLHGFNHSCAYIMEAPRVWYSLVGDGNAYAISTCNSQLSFYGNLSVSIGSCDSQECAAFSTFDDECSDTLVIASRVVFATEVGVEYFISVEAYYSFSGGEFELDVSIVETLPNDFCSDAIHLQNGTIVGSTEDAIASLTTNTCQDIFDESSFNSPDVWYRIEGAGTNLTASMCGTRTTYDSQIAVYEGFGEECNQLCIASNDDSCDNLGSAVEWFAALGSTYYIRVFGYGGDSGPFELELS